jgi:hypothetical protein
MGGGSFYNQNAYNMQEHIPLIEQRQQQQRQEHIIRVNS